MMADYAQWAAERIEVADGLTLDPWHARQDYLMWASDLGQRPHPMSRARAAIRAIGGRPKGVGDALTYHGVALKPLPPDSGYRAGGRWLPRPATEVITTLRAIQQAGLVTDRAALNTAYKALTEGLDA
jgi:hypothetical protein